MASAATLAIVIRAKDQAAKQLQRVHSQLGAVGKAAQRTSGHMAHQMGTMKSLTMSMMDFAMASGLAVVSALPAKVGLEFLAMRESAELAFETMMGSADKALEHLGALERFAEKTPFQFPDLLRASQRLQAFGWEGTQVIPTLEAIGNAVAGMGGGSEMIDRVTTAFGQMRARGKVASQEMMQLTEAGIPAWKILAEQMGTTMARVMKLVERGRVPAEKALVALEAGIRKRFGNLMERQAQTTAGAISNIKDIGQFMLADLLKPVFFVFRDVLRSIANALLIIRNRFRGLPEPLKKVAAGLAALLFVLVPVALALGALGLAIGGIKTALVTLGPALSTVAAFLLGPWGLAILAAIALAAAFYLAYESNFLGFRDLVATVFAAVSSAVGTALGWLSGEFDRFAGVIRAWTDDNWPLIQRTVETVMGAIRSVVGWAMPGIQTVIQTALLVIQRFWEGTWGTIATIATTTWQILSAVIETWIGVILGVLKLAMQLLTGDWSGAWQTVQDLAQTFVSGIVRAIEPITDLIGGPIQEMADLVIGIFTWLYDKLVGGSIVPELVNAIIGWFGILTSRVWDGIARAWQEVVKWFEWLRFSASNIVNALAGAVIDTFSRLTNGVWNGVANAWPKVVDWFQWLSDRASDIVDELAGIVTGVFDGIAGGIGDALGTVRRAIEEIQRLLPGLPSINLPGALGDVFAGVRSILGLAEGGIVTRPTLAMVGEAGPEAVVPLAAAGGGGFGGGIRIDLRGATIYGVDDLEDVIVGAIGRAQRRGRLA